MLEMSSELEEAFSATVVRPLVAVEVMFRDPLRLWIGNRPLEVLGRTFQPAKYLQIGNIEGTLDQAQQVIEIQTDQILPASMEAPDPELTLETITYTGAQAVWTAARDGEVTFHCYGAGGSSDVKPGGQGGYTRAKIAVKLGEQFTVIVGRGAQNLTTVFGFGGTGQGAAHQHNGGGLTGVFRGDSPVTASDSSRAVCIAGGGGAGGWNGSRGTEGLPGNAPGSGGMTTMQGRTATGNVSSGYGGGGGGYRGGASTQIWGTGGSGYIDPTAIEGEIQHTTVAGKYYNGTAGASNTSGLLVIEQVGIPSTYDSAFNLWLGAFDAAGAIISTPALLFTGTIESARWAASPEQILCTLIAKAGEAIKEGNTGERYNAASQQRRYPGDYGLAYVESLQTTKIGWGT